MRLVGHLSRTTLPNSQSQEFKNIMDKIKQLFDVEESADSRDSLRAMNERYRRIFKGSHGYGFMDWDIAAQEIHWNGGIWQYLGYSDEDLAQADSYRYFTFVHPDDQENMSNALRHHLKHDGPLAVTFRALKKHGGYVWAEVRANSKRNESGWATHISGIVFDITQLKQTEKALADSEARHARIFAASHDGLWEWTADEHGGTFSSKRCWEMLGFNEGDNTIVQGADAMKVWRQLMHPDDRLVYEQTLNNHLSKDEPFDLEFRMMGKDGQWRWIRSRGQMTYDENGQPFRMSGSHINITELKKSEQRVLRAKEAAEKANRAKSEFLSNMSHELRTPLNSILGFAQLLELDSNLTAEQQQNIHEICNAGKHLLSLIDDVLDLSKIEAGKLTLSMEAVVPGRLVSECFALVQSQAGTNDIRLIFEPGCWSEQVVHADNIRLKQVFLNLIINAIKYNRPNGEVTVSLSKLDDDYLRVTISDTGHGIPKHLQKDIFQPFNRLGAEDTHVEGSGVGLVITQQLVKKMKGRIGFNSEEGKGSQFWVDLHLDENRNVLPDDSPKLLKPNTIKPLTGETHLEISANKRILYIEDNHSNQRLMEQLLARYSNLELTMAMDSLRGLFLARRELPHLIILDINLPGMDGYEVLSVLQNDKLTSNIPVIALSANAMEHDIQKGQKAGFKYYLTKPLNINQILSVFNKILAD